MQELESIGLFPGGFKPPHKGHFNAVKEAALKTPGTLFVIISPTERKNANGNPFSLEESIKIWEIYLKYLPPNIKLVTATSSPVTTVYQTIENLDTENQPPGFIPPKRDSSANTIIHQIYPAAKYNVLVFASEQDLERFTRIKANKKVHCQICSLSTVMEESVKISSRNLRDTIHTKNSKSLDIFLPVELSHFHKKQILRLWTNN